MAGGFQDQGGFENLMWLESSSLVLGILFLGLFCCCFVVFFICLYFFKYVCWRWQNMNSYPIAG